MERAHNLPIPRIRCCSAVKLYAADSCFLKWDTLGHGEASLVKLLISPYSDSKTRNTVALHKGRGGIFFSLLNQPLVLLCWWAVEKKEGWKNTRRMRAHHCCPDIMSGTDPTLRFPAETSSLLRKREKLYLLWKTAMTNKTWSDPSISKPCSSQSTIYMHSITQ